MSVARHSLFKRPPTWSDMSAFSGEITKDFFSLSNAGSWKHRLLPLTVGLMNNTDLLFKAAKIGSS